jgi:hypothetical protein|nr:MAG TPA: hypothetical protein [Caudoviricetes sp.]
MKKIAECLILWIVAFLCFFAIFGGLALVYFWRIGAI